MKKKEPRVGVEYAIRGQKGQRQIFLRATFPTKAVLFCSLLLTCCLWDPLATQTRHAGMRMCRCGGQMEARSDETRAEDLGPCPSWELARPEW